jgi:predicted nucleic acid-binding protein
VSSTLREDGRVAQITSRIKAELLGVSVVTVAELKRGALAADFGERRTREIEDHLRRYIALPIDRDIAEEWARLRLRCDRLGRSKNENDLWIAATAKRHGLRLATLDRDHYDIPGLAVIQHDGTEVTVPE